MSKLLRAISAEALTEIFNKVKDAPTPLNILATTFSVMSAAYMAAGGSAANIDMKDLALGTAAALIASGAGYIHSLGKSSQTRAVIQTIASAALVPALATVLNAQDNLMCLPVDPSVAQMQKIYPLSEDVLSAIAQKEIAQSVLDRSKKLGVQPDVLRSIFDVADQQKGERKLTLGEHDIIVPERGKWNADYTPVFYNTQKSSLCAHVGESVTWLEDGIVDVQKTTADIVSAWSKKIKENITSKTLSL